MIKKIGLVAPSSPLNEDFLEKSVSFFEKRGLEVKVGKHVLDKERFMAGADKDRAQDVNEMFADSSVDAIFCLRGGYGSARCLEYLDYDMIAKNKKPLVGFSDNTAIQSALYAKSGLESISGFTPVPNCFKNVDENLIENIFALVEGKEVTNKSGKCRVEGIEEGKLVGGCLCLINYLIGTDYCPSFKDKILFLEEVGEEPYAVDRLLNHLYQSGVFNDIKGVVWGNFEGCVAKDSNDGTIEQVIEEWNQRINKPAIVDFIYGHQPKRLPLLIGSKAKVDFTNATISQKLCI
jgi:muramoyltetrapeptide carboxypeptidase